MPVDLPPGQPVFRALPFPRPPTPAELRLLWWLVADVSEELTAQVGASVVVGECRCGCSSLNLDTAAAPLPVNTVRRLSRIGRPDYISLSSTGLSATGHRVDVVLHVVDGRLHELEIFDVEAGEGTPVDPNGLSALDAPDIG